MMFAEELERLLRARRNDRRPLLPAEVPFEVVPLIWYARDIPYGPFDRLAVTLEFARSMPYWGRA
jgi:hypothetical protein